MKVINLYGGPGVGKSTTALLLSGELKKRGLNVEYIPEYAKRCVYENRLDILETDQLYVLAKQHRDLLTLSKHTMDFVIVDSPILLSAAYNKHINLNQDILNILVKELNNKYDNINIFVNRNPTFVYNPNGRTQKDVTEAIERDIDIKNQLEHFNTSFTEIMCSEFIVTDILRKVLNIGN